LPIFLPVVADFSMPMITFLVRSGLNDHVVIRFKSGSTNPTQSPMTTAGDLKKAFHGKNSHYRQDKHSENINYFEEGCPSL